MKNLIFVLISFILLQISCNSKPSLEKYFVENAENKNFLQFDLSSNVLNVNKTKLSQSEKTALQSFNKVNVLAFKINDKNNSQFELEKAKVSEILKDNKYQQLMKFGSGNQGAQVSYVGDDEHISEFVLYGNKKENGFAVVRVLGKNMNPNSVISMLSILKNSNLDLEQLKPLKELIK
jgi:Domain of unknown function (DUF4252)